MRILLATLVVVALTIAGIGALTGRYPAAYGLAPLLSLAILTVGLGWIRSLLHAGAHVPSGPAEPVDPSDERVVFHCEGCGAEVLLLARGTPLPPRHCGERMIERLEVRRAGPPDRVGSG